jgi:N-methylhydantoinase B
MQATEAPSAAWDTENCWTVDDETIANIDPFTYEIVRHRLETINEEQAEALRHTTGSVVVAAGDFNVALATARGEVVCDGNYALFHAAAAEKLFMTLTSWAPAAVGVHDGDMFFSNDPFIGALHQNDGALATPIFYQGKLVCWSAAVLHAMDVGGTEPGSFCVSASSRWDDPVRIPPIKIVDRGEIRRDVEALYLGMSRLPHLVALDLRAQISAGNVARARILELIETYGVEVVLAVMERVLNDSEAAIRQRLREFPDGTWRAVQHVDRANKSDSKIHRLFLALTKKGDRLIFDLRGSDPQAGVIGCPLNVSKAGALVPVLQFLCAGLPRSSSAVLRVCEFISDPGTLPDVTPEASTSCASASGTYMLVSLGHQCVSRMLASQPKYRDLAVASHYSSATVLTIAGTDQKRQPFLTILQDETFGAIGARPYSDGVDTGGVCYVTGGRVPDVEMNELYYPVLYLFRREAQDSGGAGRFRGGASAESAIVAHGGEGGIAVATLGYGGAFPDNLGFSGGLPSGAREIGINRSCGIETGIDGALLSGDPRAAAGYEVVPVKGNAYLGPGDVLFCRNSASGGWGDPLQRDPARVAADVRVGLVSAQVAEDTYGVVLAAAGHADVVATELRRQEIRQQRLQHPRAGAAVALPQLRI